MTDALKIARIEKLKCSAEKLWGNGIQPVMVKPLSKKPMHVGWLENFLDIRDIIKEIKAYPDANIGGVLGAISNRVMDFDVDERNAIDIAQRIMPPTSMVFGRPTAPKSHLEYRVFPDDLCVSVEYRHPTDGRMIAELRGNSRMTVFPPSIHESGEQIEYECGCDLEPSEVSYAVLCLKSSMVCCAFILAEHWKLGSRHNKTKAFAGLCATNGIEEIICEEIIGAVIEAANDEEQQDRLTAIRTTYQRHREGQRIDGTNALAQLTGESTANRLTEWMGVKRKKETLDHNRSPKIKQEMAVTDLDFARSFARFLNDDMIFRDARNSFFERNFGVYSAVSDTAAMVHVHRFIDQQSEASTCDVEADFIKRMKSSDRMNSVLRVSKTLINVTGDNFDRNPRLAGCKNGVLDIEKGMLVDTNEYVTRRVGASFDQNAECIRFEQFLETIFAADPEIILYLQRVLGYILSGLTNQQCMFIFVGEGSNGKSTLQNVIYKVMGEYASAASMQTLVKDKFGSLKTDDIAALDGCRYVFAQEAESSQSLAEAKIKRMTGGDPIAVRALYSTQYTTQPVFKLCLFTNRVPRIDATDNAIWRRLHIIPFSVTIPPEDRVLGLDSILANEGSGILNWMIKGFQDFARMGGLCPPQSILNLRNEFRTGNDTVEQFTATCCDTTDKEASTPVNLLHDTYVVWCSSSGIDPIATSEFGKGLQRLGFDVKRRKAGNHRLGIKLVLSHEE